ncbi:MAG: hypothetical protein AAF628_22925 [Planctomycetota bacterium]
MAASPDSPQTPPANANPSVRSRAAQIAANALAADPAVVLARLPVPIPVAEPAPEAARVQGRAPSERLRRLLWDEVLGLEWEDGMRPQSVPEDLPASHYWRRRWRLDQRRRWRVLRSRMPQIWGRILEMSPDDTYELCGAIGVELLALAALSQQRSREELRDWLAALGSRGKEVFERLRQGGLPSPALGPVADQAYEALRNGESRRRIPDRLGRALLAALLLRVAAEDRAAIAKFARSTLPEVLARTEPMPLPDDQGAELGEQLVSAVLERGTSSNH